MTLEKKGNHLKKALLGNQLSLIDDNSGEKIIAPIHTTHRGGKGEPFHDWYPYLEGFSSEFVKHILSEFMPNAKRIIEPFAGTGTAPVVLSGMNIECGYCEVNPAMRLIISAKMKFGNLKKYDKEKLANDLNELSQNLSTQIKSSKKNSVLEKSYKDNFGESVFFDENTFSDLLKLRTLNDYLLETSPILGECLTVSVMSKIISCSLLKRAGDVRYKTEKELAKGVPNLLDEVAKHLLVISNDCFNSPDLIGKSSLLSPNAKNLITSENFHADGVITSPPYLNGTNYFRNTKLELWYAKFLVGESTLRSFRDQAITSGINDVGKSQGRININESVKNLVGELQENAYDSRIPRMVAGYFEDMTQVILGLAKNCNIGSAICIDIGDSRYGGVHVPTHDILANIGIDLGLAHLETVHLRTRLSKDKSKLSQSLIILKKVK